jgi:CheY-like chemotaxis protein
VVAVLRVLGVEEHGLFVRGDGAAGVACIAANAPDVAIIDIGLPVMGGLDVARAVRRERRSALVLIALTGHGDADVARASAAAGFNHHLVKPVDIDIVIALVEG